MKMFLMMCLMLTAVLFSAEKLNPDQRMRIIMTDEAGMPLEDGFYNVTFRIYDSARDGNMIEERTENVESKNGVCKMCGQIAEDFKSRGYKEIWVSVKIESYPETRFRTRIFLDREK